MIILFFFGAVVLLGLAAQLWGADSRPSFQDPRLV